MDFEIFSNLDDLLYVLFFFFGSDLLNQIGFGLFSRTISLKFLYYIALVAL